MTDVINRQGIKIRNPPYAGWILFNEPKVFTNLDTSGSVYTVRDKSRREGWGYARVGRKNMFKVLIIRGEIGTGINRDTLEKYVTNSGFSNVDEWLKAIKRQHGDYMTKLALFWVEKVVDVR